MSSNISHNPVREQYDEITSFLNNYCDFGEQRCYMLWAIARRKQNPGLSNSEEVVHRKIINDTDEIEDAVISLLALIGQRSYHWRVYLTVNARNTLKAYLNFRNTMNEWIQDLLNGQSETNKKLGSVSSYWKSEVHKPEVRDDQYFQFDLDDITESEVETFVSGLPTRGDGTEVHELTQETPNGYHVITKPFNYTDWEPPVEYDELDNDGQVHVAEIVVE